MPFSLTVLGLLSQGLHTQKKVADSFSDRLNFSLLLMGAIAFLTLVNYTSTLA